jgi:hypothetical protein
MDIEHQQFQWVMVITCLWLVEQLYLLWLLLFLRIRGAYLDWQL